MHLGTPWQPCVVGSRVDLVERMEAHPAVQAAWADEGRRGLVV